MSIDAINEEEKAKLKQELLKIHNEQEQNQRSFIMRMEELTQQREQEVSRQSPSCASETRE